VAERRWSSWLEGPELPEGAYAGSALGLPESGKGSIAGFGVRLGAFALDLLLSYLVAVVVIGAFKLHATTGSIGTIVFIVESILLVWSTGQSAGMRLRRIGVVAVNGSRPSILAVVARTIMLVLLIPAVIVDASGRGLHDRLVGTVVVRF
jgi:uncharacterized RDD family membrane protein YckC